MHRQLTVPVQPPPNPKWMRALPWVLGLVVAVSTIFIWRQLLQDERDNARIRAGAFAQVVAREVASQLRERHVALDRFVKRWRSIESPDTPIREQDAEQYLEDYPALHGLVWLNEAGEATWQRVRSQSIGERSSAWIGQTQSRTDEAPFQLDTDGGYLWVDIPISEGHRMVAWFDAIELLQPVLTPYESVGFDFVVGSPGGELFRHDSAGGELLVRETTVPVDGLDWTVRAWIGAEMAERVLTAMPTLILIGGLLLAATFTTMAQLALTARQGRRIAEHATEELERSNRELEQFAYVASHDLQEPLRMVASYTQLLERRYGDQLDADAREFIGYAVDGAQRMQRLIQDLLQYSRIGTQGQPPEPVDANQLLDTTISNLAEAIRETDAVITRDELPVVQADAGQLTRVFQNLLANAIKFRGDKPPQIHVTAVDDGDAWRFAVADNGIGIQPQHFDRVFEIFQRLHGRGEYPGTGIGLAVCRRIVERHGGRLWLESEAGRGSTFYFTIPKSDGDAA